jgi:hypothetical protein
MSASERKADLTEIGKIAVIDGGSANDKWPTSTCGVISRNPVADPGTMAMGPPSNVRSAITFRQRGVRVEPFGAVKAKARGNYVREMAGIACSNRRDNCSNRAE